MFRNATMITVLPHFLITTYSVNFITGRQPMGKLTIPHGVSESSGNVDGERETKNLRASETYIF
jgi:hypothetical protein